MSIKRWAKRLYYEVKLRITLLFAHNTVLCRLLCFGCDDISVCRKRQWRIQLV